MRPGSGGRRGPVMSPGIEGDALLGGIRCASRLIGSAFRAHRWIIGLAVLYGLLGTAAATYYGFFLAHRPRLYMSLFIDNADSLIIMTAVVAAVVTVIYAIYVMVAL